MKLETVVEPIELQDQTPRVESHVLVPLYHTVISGVFAGLFVLVLCFYFRWPIAWGAIIGAGVSVVVWSVSMAQASFFLFLLERVAQKDINHDGAIGEPSHIAVAQSAEARTVVNQQVRNQKADNLKAELIAFVRLIYRRQTTAENALGFKGGKREQYLQWRKLLIDDLGLAEWKTPGNQSSGWRMRTSEDAAIRLIEHHVFEV